MSRFFFIIFFFYCYKALASERVHLAVASNFVAPLNIIKKEFLKENDTSLIISKGSTAKLYSQIINNAPIDIFLSADQSTLQKIPKDKKIESSQFTYAIGRLLIFSKNKINKNKNLEQVLKNNRVKQIVIANPRFSPYGRSTVEILEKKKIWSNLKNKIILASNVNHVSSFIFSGNADLGFISYSDKMKILELKKGYFFEVPSYLYTEIKQDVLLMKRAEKNSVAQNFLVYLKSSKVKKIIKSFGYNVKG